MAQATVSQHNSCESFDGDGAFLTFKQLSVVILFELTPLANVALDVGIAVVISTVPSVLTDGTVLIVPWNFLMKFVPSFNRERGGLSHGTSQSFVVKRQHYPLKDDNSL